MRTTTVIVLAKEPLPGRVKTRLTPEVSPADAARLAAAAISDTMRAVEHAAVRRRVLAFDGDATAIARPGWDVIAQPSGGLDERLGAAFGAAGRGSALLVGMDTPQLSPLALRAYDPGRFDACLGLAADGGFWTIGFRDASVAAALIAGVPMSTVHTGRDQLARLHDAGLRVQLLGELVDVDTVREAAQVAAMAPRTAFARTWFELRTSARQSA